MLRMASLAKAAEVGRVVISFVSTVRKAQNAYRDELNTLI